MGIIESAPSGLPETNTAVAREPKGYLSSYSLAYFGIMLALLTPVMVTMALKVKRIDPVNADTSLGLILGIGAFAAMIANPIAGRLSDRTTARLGMRTPWILTGMLGGFASLVVIGLAQNIITILIGWAMAQALFNAALAAMAATLPDQVPVNRRGIVSGVVGMIMPFAILSGSLIADQLSSDMIRFAVPGLVAVVLGAWFCFRLKDRVLEEKPTDKLSFKELASSFVFNPRKHPDFGWVFLTKFLIMFGYAGIATYLPYYLMDRFSLDEKGVTGFVVLYNLISVAAMVISSPLGGWLSDKFQMRRPFVTFAGVIMALGLILLSIAPSTSIILVAAAIIGFGTGAFFSVDQALAMDTLPNPENNAKDLGVLNIANALPQSLAPAIAPVIIAMGNATALGGYVTWYLFGACIALTGAILVMRIKGVR